MPRRKRSTPPWLGKCCYHVSNTVYDAARIFRFANMRTLAADRLRALKDRHDISVLNYLLHPDGYRLLVEARHPGRITEALRAFHAGTTADYMARKNWEGPVWRQRGTSITLVRKGPHALRCSLDMDFQMVRSGDPGLFHPLLWKHTGHEELTGMRKRYRITDRRAVCRCMMDTPWEDFKEWYITAATAIWTSGAVTIEPWWENALVVGDQQLCEAVADNLPSARLELTVHPGLATVPDLRNTRCWTVTTARKRAQEFIRSLAPKK